MLDFAKNYSPQETTAELVRDVMGVEFWQRLVTACGGLEFNLPTIKALHDNHILVRQLGRDNAERLCRELSGLHIDVPKQADRAKHAEKRERLIRQRINEGKSRAEIAGELEISMRQLRRITAKLDLAGVSYVSGQSGERLSPFEIKARDRIIDELVAGKITLRKAALELELEPATIAALKQNYLKLAGQQANGPLQKPGNAISRDSNGGLTGVEASLRYPGHQKHETPLHGALNRSFQMGNLIMNAINTYLARVINPVLTTLAHGYKHPDRIGHVLFPPVDVMQRGGQVLRFNKDSFRIANARRAPGADTKTIQLGYLAEAFYLVQDALDATVPREHMDDAAQVPGIDLGLRAVSTVMNNLTLILEHDQAKLATDPGNYDANHKMALVGADKWDDPASDPEKDIDDAKDQVRLTTGTEPNRMGISKPVFKALKRHPKIKDQFKYTSSDSITAAMLANVFDLDQLAVGKSVMLESPDDDAAFTDVWGLDAILAYVPTKTTGFEEPSFGYTYRLKGHPQVESERWDGGKKSWLYGVTYERVPVLCGAPSGFLFQGAVNG